MAVNVRNAKEQVDVHFPKGGIDLSVAFYRQLPKQLPSGEYARTTPRCINAAVYDSEAQRARGGSRPGLKKLVPGTTIPAPWLDTVTGLLVGPGWSHQDLNLMVGVGTPAGGNTVQTSNSGRVVYLVAVAAGRVFTATPGDSNGWVEANYSKQSETDAEAALPALNMTGLVYSAPNNQKMFFVDGDHMRYYDARTNTVFKWVASVGTLPTGTDPSTGATTYPRLICTWRGRTVLSGIIDQPQNWFMSRQGDPFDWDIAPVSPGPQDPIDGNDSPLGLIGDVVNGLCPYTDDILVIFGDHTIWLMRGDPADGGRIDLISDVIGGAWGICWCKDDVGTVYFFSNKCGIFTMIPGQAPVRISQAIQQLLTPIDTGANSIRLVFDAMYQRVYVFVTPINAPGPAMHFIYEVRTGAWFVVEFANVNHNPLCCTIFDGNLASDRVIALGSWDGYVRGFDPTAEDDDGFPIESEVIIGPFTTPNLDDVTVYSLQAAMGADSGDVTLEILAGETAEIALRATPTEFEIWGAGRNLTDNIRVADHAVYLRLTSTAVWSMESIRAEVGTRGLVRQRGA